MSPSDPVEPAAEDVAAGGPAETDPVTGGDPHEAELAAEQAAASASAEDEAELDVEVAAVDVEEDLEAMGDLARQRDDYLDDLRRMRADFENYKKRVAKQQTEHMERAAESLVDKLLPVLDTADLAVAHGGDVAQVRNQLLDALVKQGLERIDPEGGPFDPTLHDAVAHEPGDGAQEVAEVLRAGYRWNGRVLRPAMVKVRG